MRIGESRLGNGSGSVTRDFLQSRTLITIVILAVAAVLGLLSSTVLLGLVGMTFAGLLLLRVPALGVLALIVFSLILPLGLPTGTEVVLNPATVLVPVLAVLLAVIHVRRRDWRDQLSRPLVPWYFLTLALVVSMLVGHATWDPMVPRGGGFVLVQLAQIALYVFSAAAFWVGSVVLRDQKWLSAAFWVFLALGGFLALIMSVAPLYRLTAPMMTIATIRAPFWPLLFSMAGGQLLFNHSLTRPKRLALMGIVSVVILNVFVFQREAASNWVGVSVALAAFVWLRWPKFRWVALFVAFMLVASGLLLPTVWHFAGGDAEWVTSGGSRLLLIERVMSDSMRNPLLGLGPVAYRLYGATRPLAYQNALWLAPQINSHNNYVDLFSFGGLIALVLFFWFAVEVGRLGLRMRQAYQAGFEAGFVNAMLATGASALAIMMLADWILPFVYNIGFEGFQASVLVWLFLGGVEALDRRSRAISQESG
jgi:hypothetical protein